jgi:hypothetical protein
VILVALVRVCRFTPFDRFSRIICAVSFQGYRVDADQA